MSAPLTEADIIAARTRAAEGQVPWDRAKTVQQAIEAQAKKALEQKRFRRNRILLMTLGATLFLLAFLGWLATRS